MIEILTDNHYPAIMGLFDQADSSVRIISPFLTDSMADRLCKAVKAKGLACTFITRLYINDIFHHANSIDAMERMMQAGIAVYAVKGLHTKLYLFDDMAAVLGSANFTSGGLKTNLELSLLFQREPSIQSGLEEYWTDLLGQIRQQPESLVTQGIIDEARVLLQRLWKSNKGPVPTVSTKMYGAMLDRKREYTTDEALSEISATEDESDLVFDLFREAEVIREVKYPHTIWLKFDGDAEARIDGDEPFPIVQVKLHGKRVYVQNYPRRPVSVMDGDEVYLAAITTDAHGKNQPVIMGRGTLCGILGDGRVDGVWVREYEWMKQYPWFCVVQDCEILNTTSAHGIPLDSILQSLGSDTYLVSFGRGEDVQTVAKKHYQKAHIRLSGNAKDEIDRQFEMLKKQYGTTHYTSEA